jgi:two-component system OmpR family sensor kinase
MTGWTRLPIRARLTITFAVGLALSLAALGAFVYVRTGAALLASEDAGLSSRAEVVAADVRAGGPALTHIEANLIERDESFAQIADSTGRILESSPNVSGGRLVPAAIIRSTARPMFVDRVVPGIDNTSRVLLVPVQASRGRFVVLVGTSLQDRRDSMVQLAATLGIGGTVGLGLISFIAWMVVGGALRPVERMRRQAADISASDPSRRLSVSSGGDEIALLGATLNEMLDRVEESVDRERRLIDRASHELRTPLAIQRMDLDLALSGPQTTPGLRDALRSVSEENDHLTRLAEDLLLLSRARDGELSITRTRVSLEELLDDARHRNLPRVLDAGVRLATSAPAESVRVDPGWLRQAIDNLVENALRHTPSGGRIDLRAGRVDGTVSLVVEDSGSGFPQALLDRAFEPFVRSGVGAARRGNGAGLGLAVVRTIAEAHGGRAWAENRPEGGARVTLEMRVDGVAEPSEPAQRPSETPSI